jgi:hypothetical protein
MDRKDSCVIEAAAAAITRCRSSAHIAYDASWPCPLAPTESRLRSRFASERRGFPTSNSADVSCDQQVAVGPVDGSVREANALGD